MKHILPLGFVFLYLCAAGFSSTGFAASKGAASVAADVKIRTRKELLFAVNIWMKKHHQQEWTMDELIGRVVAEAYSYRKGDSPISGSSEDFLVCLINDAPFRRALELRSSRVESIRLRKLGKPLALPLHYSLAIDIQPNGVSLGDDPEKADRWRIALATALAGKGAGRVGLAKDEGRINEVTPQEVLGSVNLARRKLRLPDLSRDELIAVLADKIDAINEVYGMAPQLASFLECFVGNKPFTTEITVRDFELREGITRGSTGEKFSIPSHESLEIDVWEPAFPNTEGTLPTHIVASHYTPKPAR